MKLKKFMMLAIVLGIMMIITPLLSVKYERVQKESGEKGQEISEHGTVRVMSSDNGFITTMQLKEYLLGSVAGEMPVSYHEEAIKAQTIACYTYLKFVSYRDKEKLGGADISDDSSVYQAYISENERQKKWGDDFSENEKQLSAIIDEVMYCYLSYEDKPAMTVYHNLCSGLTESAENVWGNKIPYLVSVVSAGDKLSPDFISESAFSFEEFKKIIGINNIDFKKSFEIKRFCSGVADNISIGDEVIKGSDFRSMFKLKSADFDVSVEDEKIRITCYGNGHFVGMSQYGADFMARQGAGYVEILDYFYPGTVLKSDL